jgi:hypothetical protein
LSVTCEKSPKNCPTATAPLASLGLFGAPSLWTRTTSRSPSTAAAMIFPSVRRHGEWQVRADAARDTCPVSPLTDGPLVHGYKTACIVPLCSISAFGIPREFLISATWTIVTIVPYRGSLRARAVPEASRDAQRARFLLLRICAPDLRTIAENPAIHLSDLSEIGKA